MPQLPRSIINWSLILLAICVFAAVSSERAFSAPPTTRPSDLPLGEPSWLSLDQMVYQEKDVEAVEKQLQFSFEPGARWFLTYLHPTTKDQFDSYLAGLRERRGGNFQVQNADGYWLPDPLPYPTTLEDVPADDRGVRLSLRIEPDTDASILKFAVNLSSSRQPVWREVEHRATVIVPLLFAVYVDGAPVAVPQRGIAKMGGSQHSIELIPHAGGERRWSLKVNAASLQKLLPDSGPHTVTVAAAFSERQRMGFTGKDSVEFEQFFESHGFVPPKGHDGPQVLVRSNVAAIKWTGKEWASPPAQNSP
jgi:hypothetical protein